MNCLFTFLMKHCAWQLTQAASTDSHQCPLVPTTARSGHQHFGLWAVFELSLIQTKCWMMPPHLQGVGSPTRRHSRPFDTSKVFPRKCLGSSFGAFCGSLGESYLGVSNVNTLSYISRDFPTSLSIKQHSQHIKTCQKAPKHICTSQRLTFEPLELNAFELVVFIGDKNIYNK